jgi:hypothetical protein
MPAWRIAAHPVPHLPGLNEHQRRRRRPPTFEVRQLKFARGWYVQIPTLWE